MKNGINSSIETRATSEFRLCTRFSISPLSSSAIPPPPTSETTLKLWECYALLVGSKKQMISRARSEEVHVQQARPLVGRNIFGRHHPKLDLWIWRDCPAQKKIGPFITTSMREIPKSQNLNVLKFWRLKDILCNEEDWVLFQLGHVLIIKAGPRAGVMRD